ncbi:CPBP family intramembrane glutamic endopeptidase [Marinicella gelatinilytica]|uniref:CPBP family intramembrane glutamic endopeptidase n=1 Tax=Marinicella gelatinilytica TaxID=2996017 RepID=UPI002260F9CF|nr:CPBP family intramembrane glutamic endopeptidase [Marinicella gelatinilytica]MCX7545071.1 CPBP family intramembrane metalloprotease [Marinicella gelatinilytica]
MKMRTTVSTMLLLLAICVLWLSAHDSYVDRVNHQQQLLIHELRQGSHDLTWSLKASSDLVGGFGSGWVIQPKGLGVDPQKAEISLAFKDQFIVPNYYQELRFYWTGGYVTTENTKLQLEFSQVDSGIFYYSPLLSVELGPNQINLSQLEWMSKQGEKSEIISWHQLPALNTLVWRFSQEQDSNAVAIIRDVELLQTKALDSIKQTTPLTGLLSNQLRLQWQKQRFNGQRSVSSPPVMRAYLDISPWVLFVAAIIAIMLAIIFYHQPNREKQTSVNKQGALITVFLVALVAWSMQTETLFTLFENYSWIPIILFICPTVLLFKDWLLPKTAAWSIWLMTLCVAITLFIVSDFRWDFVKSLPLYVLWALAQQVILGPLVSDYLHHKAGLSQIAVALLCGVLFALLHLPNQMLMVATFVGGVFWSYAWLRYKNMYANAVSHALLALLFYQAMPANLLGTARVGFWF